MRFPSQAIAHIERRSTTALALVATCFALASCAADRAPTPSGTPSPSGSPSPAGSGLPQTWDEALAGTNFDDLVEAVRQERLDLGVEKQKVGLIGQDRELDAPLMRVISRAEWGAVTTECLAQAGFGATPHADGSVLMDDVPQEQGEALNYAHHICSMKYPVNPYEQMPLPIEPALRLYHHWADTSTECLRQHGIDVPEAPSEQAWLDAWKKSPETTWSPYEGLVQADPEVRDSQFRACPNEPADLWASAP